jgi:hypothetical protein
MLASRRTVRLTALLFLVGSAGQLACSTSSQVAQSKPSQYLFVWAGPRMTGTSHSDSAHPSSSDFIAVLDVDSSSADYGRVIKTTTVEGAGAMAHHTEFALSDRRTLFANDYTQGRVSIFDLSTPLTPRLTATMDSVPGYRRPHSFARLANGHVIATMQFGNGSAPGDPGGLAEFDETGRLVRVSSSADTAFPGARIRTYGVEVLPSIDRAITTSTPMDNERTAHVIQLWRLSDLALLRTLTMPKTPGDSLEYYPFEVRALPGGRSAMLNSYYCGFYLLRDLETATPRVELVHAMRNPTRIGCSVPVIRGRYEVVPIAYGNRIVSLDISDPAKPVQVSELTTDSTVFPHWASADPLSDRIVITGQDDGDPRLFIVRLDSASGRLSWDERFKDAGSSKRGISFDRPSWPHGAAGPATPHGAVFSRAPQQ